MDINVNNAAPFSLKADSTTADLKRAQPATSSHHQGDDTFNGNQPSTLANSKIESLSKVEEKNELDKVADNLTNLVSVMQKGLKFSVDEESGKQVIKVQDIESGDVIRQIPSEEALLLAEKLSEVSGILMKIEV